MRTRPLELCFAVLIAVLSATDAYAVVDPLSKVWSGDFVFVEQPEQIGNPGDNMHFISMFWDASPTDFGGVPHFKSYYIGNEVGGTITTKLARSTDGINFIDAGTVLPVGSPGAFDDTMASFSSVWKDAGTYYMVYEGAGGSPGDIGLATSPDGVTFAKQGQILTPAPGTFESSNIGTPSLYKEGNTWNLFYHGFDGTDVQTGLATGTDLTSLTRVGSSPVISTELAGWDSGTVGKRSRITKEGSFYYMAYEGSTDQNPGPGFADASWNSGIARSTDLINWNKMPSNPSLRGTNTGFGYDGPEMVNINDELYIYYRRGANQTVRAKAVPFDDPTNQRVINFGIESEFADGETISDWGFIGPNIAKVADNGPSVAGTTAASVTVNSILDPFEQFVAKSVPITSGELLDFSFDYKFLPGAIGESHVQLRYYDGVGANGFSEGGGGTFLGEHTVTLSTSTTGSWLTNSLKALPNPDPSANFVDIRVIANAFGLGFQGTMFADNFIVETYVPTVEVTNPGFETGDFTNWGFAFPNASVVADNGPSESGSFAAQIDNSGSEAGFQQFVSEAIPISSGELLDLSFDFKTLAGATGDWTVQLRYWDGVGENGFSDGAPGVNNLGTHSVTLGTTDGFWLTNELLGLLNPDSNATYVDIRVIADAFGLDFDGVALVDNFQLSSSSTASIIGDYNGDGVVDAADYTVWRDTEGDTVTPGSGADGDGDGIIGAGDYTAWVNNFGASSSNATSVPEPTALFLVLATISWACFRATPRVSCY